MKMKTERKVIFLTSSFQIYPNFNKYIKPSSVIKEDKGNLLCNVLVVW